MESIVENKVYVVGSKVNIYFWVPISEKCGPKVIYQWCFFYAVDMYETKASTKNYWTIFIKLLEQNSKRKVAMKIINN